MKLKKTNLLFLVVLIVLTPLFAMESSAATYPVTIVQNPTEVYASEIIIITAVVDMIRDEEIISARLSHILTGDTTPQPSIYCEETTPTLDNVVTFIFGPFVEGDFIQYKIYIDFHSVGVEEYQSDWYAFAVGGTRSGLTIMQIVYICLGSVFAVGVVVVSVIVLRKRR